MNDWIQFALLIPVSFLAVWIRILNTRIDKMIATTYTKKETTEMIALHLAPLETKLDNIDATMLEVKELVREVIRNGQSRD
jgi:hypothetical protein